MTSMTRQIWIAACGLTLLGLPSAAQAHGQFLQGISDTVAAELGEPACALPMVACGLCHQPKMGDRLENVMVGFDDVDAADRNGPLFDSLTMDAGWNVQPHAMDMNAHRDVNLAMLVDAALPTMLADELDSDMDGVPDLEELMLGYNPLLAYEADDPQKSQLCDSAQPFPDEGDTDTTGGDTDTTGGGDTGTTGGATDTAGGETDTAGDETDTTGEMTTSDGGTTDATTEGGGSTAGTTAGTTAADDDVGTDSDTTGASQDEEGCGCSSTNGSGRSGGALGLLGLLGLGLLRRRR